MGLLIKVRGNTDAPASHSPLGATFECKHAWLKRRRQRFEFRVSKAEQLRTTFLASSLKMSQVTARETDPQRKPPSAVMQDTDAKPKKSLEETRGVGLPPLRCLKGRGVESVRLGNLYHWSPLGMSLHNEDPSPRHSGSI